MGWGWRRAVTADLARHWRHFAAAAIGIVLGVAGLTFFLALGLQVRHVLLERVFPGNLIEVAPRSSDLDLFALRIDLGKDAFEQADLEALNRLEGVETVYPKMRLMVPAMAFGGTALFGAGMQTEVVAEGVDPRLVEGAAEMGFAARPDETPSERCVTDAECARGLYCEFGPGSSVGFCRDLAPVLISPYIVDLYNGAFRRAYRLPKINPDALDGLNFRMTFGASTLGGYTGPAVKWRMRLAGVSEHAMTLGLTLPLAEVQRINRALGSREAGDRYHSAVLEPVSRNAMPAVIESVESLGFEVVDHGARRTALGISVATAVFGLAAVILIAVSTAHIMHVFSLVVLLRRREIGVMRALGARRSDITRLVVTEAALVGAGAGVAGVGTAVVGALLVDRLVASRLSISSILPGTLFVFPAWLIAAVIALAVGACVVGSLPAASRAVSGDPSEALSGR